jgi:hypothetical protein
MSKLADVLANLQSWLERNKGDKTGGQQFSGPKEFQYKSAADKLGSLSNLGGTTETKTMSDPGAATPQQKQSYVEKIGHLHQKTGHTPYEEAGSELAESWKSERAGDIGAHLGGAVEQVGSGMGGPVGAVVEKFGELAKKLGESLEKLRKWNEQLYQANMQFAEYSGGMAAVKAEQEVRQIQLEQYRGDSQAGSARVQSKGMADLNQTLAPFESGWANIKNEVSGMFSEGLSKVLEATGVPTAMRAVLEWYNKWRFGKDEEADLMHWLHDIEKGRDKWEEFNRPKRFK